MAEEDYISTDPWAGINAADLPKVDPKLTTFYYPETPEATRAAGLSYSMEGGTQGGGQFSDVDLRNHTLEAYRAKKSPFVAVAMAGAPSGSLFQMDVNGEPIVARNIDTGGGLRSGQVDIATSDPSLAKHGISHGGTQRLPVTRITNMSAQSDYLSTDPTAGIVQTQTAEQPKSAPAAQAAPAVTQGPMQGPPMVSPMTPEEQSRTGQVMYEPSATTAGTEQDPINAQGLISGETATNALKAGLLMNPLTAPEYLISQTLAPRATQGVSEALGETAAGFTSPNNLALLGATAAFPEGVVGKVAQTTLMSYFEAQAIRQTPELWKQFKESDDPKEQAKLLVTMGIQLGLPASGMFHIIKGEPKAVESAVKEATAETPAAAPEPAAEPAAVPEPQLAPEGYAPPPPRVSPETGQVFYPSAEEAPPIVQGETARVAPEVSAEQYISKDPAAAVNVEVPVEHAEFAKPGYTAVSTLKPEYETENASVKVSGNGYIRDLFVKPAARGKGEGKALMQQVISDADQSGQPLTLHIGEQRTDLPKFYEQLGFKEVGKDQFGIKFVREPAKAEPDVVPTVSAGETRSAADIKAENPRLTDAEAEAVKTANDYVDRRRRALNLEPRTPTETRADAFVKARADQILAKDPTAGDRLSKAILEGRTPFIKDGDVREAVMRGHLNNLEAQRTGLVDHINSAGGDPVAQQELDQVISRMQIAADASARQGTDWGRAGRQRGVGEDQRFTYAHTEATLRAINGGEPVDPETLKATEKISNAIKDEQDKLLKREQELTDQLSKTEISEPKGLTSGQGKPLKPFVGRKGGNVGGFAAELGTWRELGHQIYKAGMDFATWSAEMIRHLGEKVRDHLQGMWEDMHKMYAVHPAFRVKLGVPEPLRGAELDAAKARAMETSARASDDIAKTNMGRVLENKVALVNQSIRLRKILPRERRSMNPVKQIANSVDFYKHKIIEGAKAALQQPWAEHAAKQYQGYNKRAHDMADEYARPPEDVMVAESGLSPNTSPEQSHEATRRIMKMLRDNQDDKFDQHMEDWARSKKGYNKKGEMVHLYDPADIKYLRGKKFSELPNGDDVQAKWMRAYDEVYHPERKLRTILPNGELGDFDRTSTGKENSFAWTMFNNMQAGIDSFTHARKPEEILKTAKVANYYMSKLLAFEPSRHVVVDTHHSSLAFGNSLPSKHPDVKAQFGIRRTGKGKEFGGPYAIIHEATLQAADEMKMDPKELQALVWAYQRGYRGPDSFGKTPAGKAKVVEIQNLWKDAAKGKITEEQAHADTERIAREHHGEPPAPGYFAGDRSGSESATSEGSRNQPAELPARGRLRGRTGSGERGDAASDISETKGLTSGSLSERAKTLRSAADAQGGYVNLEAVRDFGRDVYRKGMQYADWGREMIKHLGGKIVEHLRGIWDQITDKTLPGTRESGGIGGRAGRVMTDAQRLEAKGKRDLKAIKELEKKVKAGDVSKPPPRSKLILDPERQQIADRLDALKKQHATLIEKARLAQRSRTRKIIDTAQDYARAVKLMGLTIFGKLGGAGLTRVAQTTLEEMVGKALSMAPVARRVMEAAPTEGPPTMKSIAAYPRGFVKGIKQIPDVLRGTLPSQYAYEGKAVRVPKRLDIPGRTHGAVKQPFKMGQYEMALAKALDYGARRGELDKPGGIETAKELAAGSGERAINTQSNVVADWWNDSMNALERRTKSPRSSYALAKLGRWLLPIVKIPTNIASEFGTMNTWPATAGYKLVEVMRRGMSSIKPEEADFIARHLKKGLVGGALFALGYFGRNNVGGFYQSPRDKYKMNRHGLKPMEALLFGVRVPWWMFHTAGGLQIQFGATVGKLMDAGKSPGGATIQGLLEVFKEIPFLHEAANITKLLEGGDKAAEQLGHMVSGSLIPGFVREFAQYQDQGHKRAPKGFVQTIEADLPYLRQNVPLSKYQQ